MTSGNTLLIVDDDESLRRELASQLTLHEGFEVVEAGTVAEAREAAKGRPLVGGAARRGPAGRRRAGAVPGAAPGRVQGTRS